MKLDLGLTQSGKKLPLFEHFYTVQGEGHNAGKAAYFLRLGGCDVGCSWCDTKNSWPTGENQLLGVDDISMLVKNAGAKAVVVTGGEPATYPLAELCMELEKLEVERYIETSGAYSISGYWEWVCLSPKKHRPPVEEAFQMADELKVIITNERDLNWAEDTAKKVTKNCLLFLQAEWGRFSKVTPLLAEYVKQYPKWRISVQSHKFMNIP